MHIILCGRHAQLILGELVLLGWRLVYLLLLLWWLLPLLGSLKLPLGSGKEPRSQRNLRSDDVIIILQRWEMTKGWPMVASEDVTMRLILCAITRPTWMGSPIKIE